MPSRNSLCKIILTLNELIIIVIHNLATLTSFVHQIHMLRCMALSSIINELLNVLNQNQIINEMIQQFPRFRQLFSKDCWPKKAIRNVYAEAILNPNNFIRLTGLTPVTFDEIYVLFEVAATRRIILKQRHHFSLINKNILFLLVHWLRCYPSYPSLALLFSVSPQRISHLIRRFLPDLAEALKEEIKWPTMNEFQNLIVRHEGIGSFGGYIDGSRHRIQRPGRRQRIYYSGKTKYHCLASLYVIDTSRRLIFFSAGYQGSWHDSRIFKIVNLKDKPIPRYTYILGDRGFANKPPILTPYRRNELPRADVTPFQRWIFNATLSSYRIYVEHVTHEIKLYKVLSTTYRHEILNKKLYELISLCCAALANKRCQDFYVTSPT